MGLRYATLIDGRRIGFPAVHTEADYARPCAFGEQIVVELTVGRVGNSSVELVYVVRGVADGTASAPRATGRSVVAVMDLDPASATYRRALPIPPDVRAAIEGFRGERA